jgi:hypothetical protein
MTYNMLREQVKGRKIWIYDNTCKINDVILLVLG